MLRRVRHARTGRPEASPETDDGCDRKATDMTELRPISTTDAPSPGGGYSQAMIAGDFVYTCGFGPHDPTTGEIPEGIAAQTRQALRNVEAALNAAGSGLDRLVKATVHLSTLDDFPAFDEAYRSVLPGPLPVRTTVGSQLAGILVEIDVVALRR
jgi:2-iminobutanoate/2-iminopropanoate deaminase